MGKDKVVEWNWVNIYVRVVDESLGERVTKFVQFPTRALGGETVGRARAARARDMRVRDRTSAFKPNP